jgi:hypothetical protein
MQIPRIRPLTLRDRITFLPLAEPNPNENVGQVKVSQHVVAGSEIKPLIMMIMMIIISKN